MSSDESEEETIQTQQEIKDTWKKERMRTWLERRGLPKSGNKEKLSKRIYNHITGEDSDISDISDSEDEAVEVTKLAYYDIKGVQWTPVTQPDQIPPMRDEDVENYYLYSKNPTTGALKNCKRYLKKAKNYANQRKFIGTLECTTEGQQFVVRAKVRPSMKPGTYDARVVVSSTTGKMLNAQCSCKVGRVGMCAHVGGIALRLCKIKSTCTSRLSQWVMPSNVNKSLTPKIIAEIPWWQGPEQPVKPWPHVYRASACPDTDQHTNTFLEEVLDGLAICNPGCALYKLKRRPTSDISHILSKYQVGFQFRDNVNLADPDIHKILSEHGVKITVTNDEVSHVEAHTKGQSCNFNWVKMRREILTASNSHEICRRKETTPPEKLIARLCGYSKRFKTRATVHGTKSEVKARRAYMQYHTKQCQLPKISTTGLAVSKEFPFLGASLDGLMTCPTCGVVGLEIKSPFKFRYVILEILVQ